MALSDKQKAFIEHYLRCWNATEAARLAGYSEKTANEQGSRLLANVSIQESVAARLTELQASADEVLQRLTEHSRSSVGEVLDEEGAFDYKAAKKSGKIALVKKYKRTTRTVKGGTKVVTVELEMYDAQAATVQLGRARGLFVDKTALTDPTGKEPYDWRKVASENGINPQDIEAIAREVANRLNRAGSGGTTDGAKE